MKKIILLIVTGGLLAGCYHTGTAAPVEKTEPVVQKEASEPISTTEVAYSDEGFSPKAITVRVGTTVTWRNDGNKIMWVASAVHPTHQELPGFDQLEATGNGTTYSYTFTKVGTWRFHNHVAAGDTGAIVVEE